MIAIDVNQPKRQSAFAEVGRRCGGGRPQKQTMTVERRRALQPIHVVIDRIEVRRLDKPIELGLETPIVVLFRLFLGPGVDAIGDPPCVAAMRERLGKQAAASIHADVQRCPEPQLADKSSHDISFAGTATSTEVQRDGG